jgi:RND family efflux transporter MFP subunit
MPRALVFRAVAFAIAPALLVAGCGGGEAKKAEQKAEAREQPSSLTVTAVRATAQPLPRTVRGSGSVAAWNEVPVGSEAGGLTAVQVLVDEGAWVRQGQTLVKLNDDVLRAQLRQQDASVASAQALLAQNQAALGRAQELRQRGFLSQASLEQAQANQRTAAAQLAAAQASRAETATRLDQTNVRAPVSGLITARSVVKGQIVAAGTELFRLVRDGQLELNAQIPETELPLVRPGMSAQVSASEVGTVTGRVRVVTPQVDPQTRLGVARISLTGSGLRPGMFAETAIDVGAAPTVAVPQAAVVFRDGKPGVYVIATDNRVRFRPVTTGPRIGQQVSIVSGLAGGERVAVQGAGFLGEGDRVTVAAAGSVRASAPVQKRAAAKAD